MTLQSKANRGILALGIRQIIVQGCNILGTTIVARAVSIEQYGFFAVVGFFLTFLTLFSDVGLGACLIIKSEEPTNDEYSFVFTFQQIFIFIIAVFILVCSSILNHIYSLTGRDSYCFPILAIALFITTFQVIPQISLERRLDFSRLAKAEIGQAIIYNIMLITFTFSQFGSLGFCVAILIRTIYGVLALNILNPVRLNWKLNMNFVKANLPFGLSYQGSKLVSLIKDSVNPIIIGILLGKSAVGIINWANILAAYSVMALVVLQRLYLPTFVRLLDNRNELIKYLNTSLSLANGITAPLAILTLVLLHPITELVFGIKWLTALPAFYFFWLANIFVPTSTVLQGIFNALGKANIVFFFSVTWMLLTWALSIPLAKIYGFKGVAIANFLVQFTNVALIIMAWHYVKFNLFDSIKVWLMALVMGTIIYLLEFYLPIVSIINLLIMIFLGILIYVLNIMIGFPHLRIAIFNKLKFLKVEIH